MDVDPAGIRRLRTSKGWTQAQLARALGTDAVTVSRWERGVSHPRRSAQIRLVALGVVPATILRPRFAEDPETRIRKLDRARQEQIELKNSVRFRG